VAYKKIKALDVGVEAEAPALINGKHFKSEPDGKKIIGPLQHR
jgi:hypothetical protein